MAAYVIYQAEVTDPEQYARYREKSTPSVVNAGGEFLVRGGEIDLLEGEPPLGRIVIAKFASMEAARAWYDSEAYREARVLREGAVLANLYLVDGAD
jgi:uncharacterized protein (DUF1330 family)